MSNFVIGNKTKIFFSVLPDSLLDAPVAPTDVTITLSAAATLGAISLLVTALSGPVPAGTAIVLTSGSGGSAVKTTVYTTESAKAGATALKVEATSGAIASGATGSYKAMLLLVGGTTSDEQIQANDQEVTVYGDDLGFSTGIVTKANWSISYSFNVLPSDLGYARLVYAAQNAVKGIHAWVRKEDPAPAGYTTGEIIEGLCQVTDFSKSNPADGIITGKCTFKGRGTPTLSHYV